MAETFSELSWGITRHGEPVRLFNFANDVLRVSITNFGARLVSIQSPDRDGIFADVVLGHSTLAAYENDHAYLGSVCGRYANRLANGRFLLDGYTIQVPQNDGPNALHGGHNAFDKRVWSTKQRLPQGFEFTLVSPDGDQGFPGELTASIRYTLDANTLVIEYEATTTKSTVVNLTNHAYFNLTGDFTKTVLEHELQLNASHITPVDPTMIPLGELASVQDTPFDFRVPRALGERIGAENEQLKIACGYDHNYVLDAPAAAYVYEPFTGRTLSVYTTEPGIQLYTGNFLAASEPVAFAARTGFCLETQHFPDSPNHPKFPSTVLQPGETFRSHTKFTFGFGVPDLLCGWKS